VKGFGGPSGTSGALISVIIPCFNLAYLLGEAIDSVLAQTDQRFELIVVDDGSRDECEAVATRYGGVRYLRQDNQGLAAARNAGLAASAGELQVFLDADDRLLPRALEIGRRALAGRPELAFVSGHFRCIALDGQPHPDAPRPCPSGDLYLALLRKNYIAMHGTVMYRRAVLERVGGFEDPGRGACEDYALYLRIAREHPIACHHQVVAEYRLRPGSMSDDPARMLTAALRVLQSERQHLPAEARYRSAYDEGRRSWQAFYSRSLIKRMHEAAPRRDWGTIIKGLGTLGRRDPRSLMRYFEQILGRASKRVLPRGVYARLPAILHPRSYSPPVGRVQFGHLRRTEPIDRQFGYGRGLPIDRYYIERFLAQHADDVQGRVLEVADDTYTRRFGGDRVTRRDVLDVRPNPSATIAADLTCSGSFPPGAFDCVILTQTLHLIYDVRSALRTVFTTLRPGGVALITAPGISHMADPRWRDSWFWGFTSQSLGRLVREVFPAADVELESHGNVLAAIAFLEGLAVSELTPEELDGRDPDYELVVTVRAVRPRAKCCDDWPPA
jgi:glycosyltransferase involved in cell wall biosynthesis/SAM-dependent methyltransferase